MFQSCDSSCDYDYEIVFLKSTTPVARKRHRCCECGEAIEPGSRYDYQALRADEFYTVKTCLVCAAIRRDWRGCQDYGDLWEAIHESHNGCDCGDEFCMCPQRRQDARKGA